MADGILPDWRHFDSGQYVWTLQIHAQPGAKRNAVIGAHGGRLKLKIAAPAVDNKANACLLEFLSTLLGVARNQITIVRGERGRQKTLAIQNLGVELKQKLDLITTIQG